MNAKRKKIHLRIIIVLTLLIVLVDFQFSRIFGMSVLFSSGNVLGTFLFEAFYISSLTILVIGIYKAKVNIEKKIVMVSVLATIFLGWLGYLNISKMIRIDAIADALYYALQLFAMGINEYDNNLLLDIARFTAVFALFGMAITLFAKEGINKLLVKLTYRNHIVMVVDSICDYRRSLIMNHWNEDNKVVVIHDGSEEYDILKRMPNIRLLKSEDYDDEILMASAVAKAKLVFLYRSSTYDNIAIGERVHLIKKKKKGRFLLCNIHYNTMEEKSLILKYKLFEKIYENFDARIFNIYDSMAAIAVKKDISKVIGQALIASEPIKYMKHNTIGMMGDGKLQPYIFEQCIRQCHYGHNSKIVINTIGKLFPELHNERVEKLILLKKFEPENISNDQLMSTIFICYDDVTRIHEALVEIFQQGLDLYTGQILVFMEDDGVGHLLLQDYLDRLDLDKRDKVELFSIKKMIRNVQLYNQKNESAAKNIHECYEIISGTKENTPWELLSEYERESNRYVYNHLMFKYEYLNNFADILSDDRIYEDLAIMEHNRWKAEKVLEGYVYGEVKSNSQKTNPLLLPWDKLSQDDRKSNIAWTRKLISEYAKQNLQLNNN